MTERLRDHQRRVARERILDAVAAEVLDGGLMNLSIQAVADRAGVSHRTVYNYFESKDGLLQALGSYLGSEMEERGGRNLPDDLETLPDAVRANWLLFDEAGDKARAVARVRAELSTRGAAHLSDESIRRTEALRDAVSEFRPDLVGHQLDAVVAIIRLHVGFDTWYRLTHEFGLSAEDGGAVSAWAIRVMRDALASGSGPFD